MMWWILLLAAAIVVVYAVAKWQRTARLEARVRELLSDGREWTGVQLALACETSTREISNILEQLERDDELVSRPQFAYDDAPSVRFWKLAPPRIVL